MGPKRGNSLTSKKRAIQYIQNAAGIIGFILLWQFLLEIGILNEKFMPSPFDIAKTFVYKLTNENPDGAVLFVHIFTSFKVAITGFAVAVVIGVTLGTLMGWYKPVEKFVKPLFEVVRPISPIAWIPLTILWLGIGLKAKAFIIFFSAFVPSVINSYTGVKNTPELLINVAKTFGAKNFQIFTKVAVPYSLPMTFAGIRISLNNAWATLVGAEMLASDKGLGYLILQGRMFGKADIIIVGMLTIGLVGLLLSYILTKIEGFVIHKRVAK